VVFSAKPDPHPTNGYYLIYNIIGALFMQHQGKAALKRGGGRDQRNERTGGIKCL
jgi:hypothetical protein